MHQILLVNPSPRPSRRKARQTTAPKKGTTMKKPHRSAAQRAATRKLVALNRARKTHPKRAAKRRAANPAPRRAKARRSTAVQARAAGRVLRYRRKNPVGGVGAFVSQTLVPSAVGGAGALALDVLLGALPLPASLKTGPMRPVVQVAGAIGLGFAAGVVASRRVAGQVASGALTVTLYDIMRRALVKASAGKIPGLSAYEDGVGEYVGMTEAPALGYTDSGLQVGEYEPTMGEYVGEQVSGYETGVYR